MDTFFAWTRGQILADRQGPTEASKLINLFMSKAPCFSTGSGEKVLMYIPNLL